ncbi:MAG: 2-hydroxychromene-2-carboxylate isomerase [Pacificimonas sp.]
MTKTVEFIFDFVSPNGYLAWYPLKGVLKRTGAELKITPAFLGGMHKLTGNQPPFIAFADVKGKNEYNMLELRRFVAKHGLTKFKMNPHFPMNTITPLRMLMLAENEGRGEEFADFLLPHVWEQGADIGDKGVLLALLADGPFDGEDYLARTQKDDVKAALIANTENAVERGAFGIPTFFVEDEMYFGKDRLDGVEEELTR